MLFQEAQWIGRTLAAVQIERLTPVLSIGSGNRDFRVRRQPWVERFVYGPLEQRGVRVLHHELLPADGVDIAGDLTDPAVKAELRQLGVRSVMCCNVLEHLQEPSVLANEAMAITAEDGLALFTVPRRFPFHPDPLDTMFRPTPAEIAALIPGATVEAQATVQCDSLLRYWLRSGSKRRSLVNGLRSIRSANRQERGSMPTAPAVPARERVEMALLRTEVSCALLRRDAG